mmetsp:Transcript_9392/g.23377  ORF Transcript_9392/g.23377 Transcript_9392/m.23377 type:complete len:97 (+) Transcript_9392:530-820(+)
MLAPAVDLEEAGEVRERQQMGVHRVEGWVMKVRKVAKLVVLVVQEVVVGVEGSEVAKEEREAAEELVPHMARSRMEHSSVGTIDKFFPDRRNCNPS